MKRRDLIKLIESYGCYLKRNGANHDIYYNPENNKIAPIPRHNELKNSISELIIKQLELK